MLRLQAGPELQNNSRRNSGTVLLIFGKDKKAAHAVVRKLCVPSHFYLPVMPANKARAANVLLMVWR